MRLLSGRLLSRCASAGVDFSDAMVRGIAGPGA